jgi:hypothetical protein
MTNESLRIKYYQLRIIIIIWIANLANLINSDLHLGLIRFNPTLRSLKQLNQGLIDISTLQERISIEDHVHHL